jgi:ribonuclease HI
MLMGGMVKVIKKTQVVGITWINYPGNAGVHGNEEADRLAVSAPVGGQLLHDRKDVIKALGDKV